MLRGDLVLYVGKAVVCSIVVTWLCPLAFGWENPHLPANPARYPVASKTGGPLIFASRPLGYTRDLMYCQGKPKVHLLYVPVRVLKTSVMYEKITEQIIKIFSLFYLVSFSPEQRSCFHVFSICVMQALNDILNY